VPERALGLHRDIRREPSHILASAVATTSIFAFATDLAGEGVETVLENVQERAGLNGLSIAASYHEGRDVFPHNPVRKVRFLESGAAFFPLEVERWRGVRLRPPVSEAAGVFPETIAAAAARGLDVNAWTVFLHNGALASTHPDCAPENAFGDRYVTELCPAHPDVREYARTLAADVAALGVETICAESLHFHGLEHGHAHERYFVPLGPLARFLFGLCFCASCLDAAAAAGADGGAVRRFARAELERVLDGGAEAELEELTRNVVGSLAGGELERYLSARERTVTSLVAEVASAARGTRLELIDLAGATKGYATGRPTGGPAAASSWQHGVDVEAVAAVCDGVEVIGYAADPERLRLDVDAYGRSAVSVILRPAAPDCASAENLREKVVAARERRLGRIDFYHYGLMRLDALDLIHSAVRTDDVDRFAP